MDSRITRLAEVLVNYSTEVQTGDRLLVEMIGYSPEPLLKEVIRVATGKDALVHHQIYENSVLRTFLHEASEEQIADQATFALSRMKEMDAYIGIRSGLNAAELSDVPTEKMKAYQRLVVHPVHLEERVKNTRWCVLRYPNAAMAQLANQPLEVFEDFYFQVCNLDYARMAEAMVPLSALLDRTDRVEIRGTETDLSLSTKGLKSVGCSGSHNIPDGELFTAPVRDSVNGTILFNAGATYEGTNYPKIRLTFEDGKAVAAESPENSDKLNSVLDRDDGARYVGELAFGFNPYILQPMRDTLFDEKIAGSIHMALGACYDEVPNGNSSMVHWDMVHIQRPDYGGGEIYFDGELVRKDGVFVLPELEPLNPENLTG